MNDLPSAHARRERLLDVSRVRSWARWLTGALVAVAAVSAAILQGWPGNSAEIDEAHLHLAAAIAQQQRKADGWHTAVTLVRADRTAQRLNAHAEEAAQPKVALEQVRTLVDAPEAHPDPPLSWPVRGPVVSGYGLRAWPDFGRLHPGIDIVNLPGTPVRAAGDGVVASVRRDMRQGNGVVIDHGEQEPHPGRWTTVYGHLQDIGVAEGETVRAGEVVGTLGNTGEHSTGPHLHFEVRIENQPVDPRRWLP